MFNKSKPFLSIFVVLITLHIFHTTHASNNENEKDKPESPKNRTSDPYYNVRPLKTFDDVEAFAGTVVKIGGLHFYAEQTKGYTSRGGSKFCYITKDMPTDEEGHKYIPAFMALNKGEKGGTKKFTLRLFTKDTPCVKRLDPTELADFKKAFTAKQAFFDTTKTTTQKYAQEIETFLNRLPLITERS